MNDLKHSPLALAIGTALIHHLAWAAPSEPPNYAYFDSGTYTLYLPEIDAGTLGIYSVRLHLSTMEPVTFDLDMNSITPITVKLTFLIRMRSPIGSLLPNIFFTTSEPRRTTSLLVLISSLLINLPLATSKLRTVRNSGVTPKIWVLVFLLR